MTRHRDFLTQLENFRQEAYWAAQYLYSDMAVQHAASKSERLLASLNLTPRFWLAHTAASQTAAYVCLGRIFDTKSRYNIDALINAFEANLHLFSRESLAERKRDGKLEESAWLHTYLSRAHFPNAKDVVRLRAKVAEYRAVYDRAVKPARHKYIAHREKEESMEVQALFAGGKVRELWRMVTFLHALYTALWEQYHNGRKPVLRALRFSVGTIYDAKHQRSSPHEAVISDTKKLMQFIERAPPNPSI
jgi:AbiU2